MSRTFTKSVGGREQQRDMYNKIFDTKVGLHVVYNTLESGKTFMIKFITYNHVLHGKSIVLMATTSATALCLSHLTAIVHHQFSLPKKNDMFHTALPKADDHYYALHTTHIIIIDEISMMTCQMMNLMIRNSVRF